MSIRDVHWLLNLFLLCILALSGCSETEELHNSCNPVGKPVLSSNKQSLAVLDKAVSKANQILGENYSLRVAGESGESCNTDIPVYLTKETILPDGNILECKGQAFVPKNKKLIMVCEQGISSFLRDCCQGPQEALNECLARANSHLDKEVEKNRCMVNYGRMMLGRMGRGSYPVPTDYSFVLAIVLLHELGHVVNESSGPLSGNGVSTNAFPELSKIKEIEADCFAARVIKSAAKRSDGANTELSGALENLQKRYGRIRWLSTIRRGGIGGAFYEDPYLDRGFSHPNSEIRLLVMQLMISEGEEVKDALRAFRAKREGWMRRHDLSVSHGEYTYSCDKLVENEKN